MKKNIKSLIGVLLCLVMLMSLMGTAAFADDPVISPSFTKDEKWEETPGETYTGVLCWDPHYTAVKWKEIAGSEDFVSDGIWNEITELASGEDTITVSKLSAFLMIDYKTSENDEDGNQLVIDLNSTLLSQIAVAGEGYDMSKEYSTDGYTWKEYVDGYADLDGADKFFVRDKAMPTSAEASQFVLVSANTAFDNVQDVAPLNEGEPILDPNPENQNNETLNPENQNNETLNPENQNNETLNPETLNLGNPNQILNAQPLSLFGVTAYADEGDGEVQDPPPTQDDSVGDVSISISGPSKCRLSGVVAGNCWGQDKPHIDYSVITAEMISTDELSGISYIEIDGCQAGTRIWVEPYTGASEGEQRYFDLEKMPNPVEETDYTATIRADDYSYITAARDGLEISSDGTTWTGLTADSPQQISGTVYLRAKYDTTKLASDVVTLTCGAAATYYPLWINGERVSSSNLSNDYWEYNNIMKVLHIKKDIYASYDSAVELNGLKNDAAIYYEGTELLTIKADDVCLIKASNGGCETLNNCFGIYSKAPLVLTGEFAVESDNAIGNSAGIWCEDNIEVDKDGVVTGEAGKALFNYGIWSDKTITVKGALGGKGGDSGDEQEANNVGTYGIYAKDIIVQRDTATLSGEGGKATTLGNNCTSCGIYCENQLTISDGSVSGTGSDSNNISLGTYAKTISIDKGSLKGNGGNGLMFSVGVQAYETLENNKGSIEAKSGNSMASCTGLVAGLIDMNGGSLTANGYSGTTDAINKAIITTTFDFSGGEVKAAATGSNGIGIDTAGLSLSGNAYLESISNKGEALTKAPAFSSSYTAEAIAGNDAHSATKIATADLKKDSSYSKGYVSICPIIPTTAIDLGENFSLGLNGTKTIEVKFTPETATDRELVWESKNTSVASVSASGTVTGLSKGTTTIVAKLKSNQTIYDSVKVEVTTVPVNSITLDNYTLTIPQGETATITYSIEPTTASDQRASVSSANTNVATVTGTGSSKTVTITGVNTGSTTINFETIDGKKTASCVVNVTAKTYVTGIAIADATGSTPKSITLTTKGAAQTLYAVVAPATATNKAVEWSVTGDNTVVYLTNKTDSSCVVNAYGNGTAVLTATAKDGSGKVATLNITVQDTQSTYKFTYKENSGVWYYDYGTLATYTVKCDGPYSSFSGCLMDGYIVSPNYYYVTEGSTIVTFYPQYMQTLSHGRHTLTFVYNGTTTVSTYIWSRSLRDPPITGDSGTAGLIAAMSVSALAAASCTFFVRKKKEN